MQPYELKETAIYVHIPFCDHKCIYCDFYSIITSDNILSFLNSLKKEIICFAKKYSEGRVITSIYFGGGTPSLMSPEYLEEIIAEFRKSFYISGSAEVTMETNPGTVDQLKLREFKDIGINRISIGVQSFDDNDLKFMTRIHDRETAIRTIEYVKNIGYENISLDLIFNLPGQSMEKWLDNLKTAVDQPVTHISAYSLILERGTILNKMVLDGKIKMRDDDHDAGLYETTIDFLTGNGFYQYEVSNFTKPGFECKHNNSYWNYKDYLGFGTSSHSFVNGKRWWNYSSLRKYINEIKKNSYAIANSEILSEKEKHNEYVMLALRSSGIILDDYKKIFGKKWLDENYTYFEKLKNQNLVKLNGDVMKLTAKGYAVCDEILKNIL
ncbi:MAG: radical SAM family heme chaperone HemW [Ignavibacteria bacterium]